ncbi:UNVERIFIED_CONTAM: hypothetical protein GTU68_066750, partial [Idotea baltica]|nr:hypothetical protein [Idotea baltica]
PFVPTGLPNQTFVSDAEGSNPDIEPFPSEWKGREAVRIRNLHKVFKSKGKEDLHAVDGISMDIYEGQITAILGHNGAGKTTLFNMLTGMISPSKGWASIFNLDICDLNDLAEIRQLTGVCPQHDILFLNLTPKEHLTFYARIKGIDSQLIEGQVAQMLLDIDLTSKANTKANDLSGGQKRKLSIGIALIGDPKILFLDEPTAGVDAYSRRHLWALLKKKKKGKVILLTTHFMDEADILADRKAVVSKGKLRCYGTSLFLKNKFGLGYHLTLVISESREAPETSERLVKEVIPQAELARHYGKELSFILPSASSTKFSPLFCALDSNIADAGGSQVESYGISMTTLEEVFLALNEESEKDEIGSMENLSRQLIRARSPSLTSPSQHSSPNSPSHLSSSLPPQPNGALPAPEHNATLPKQQEGFRFDEVRVEKDKWRAFRALVKLRITNLRRELNAVFFLVVFPLVLVVASIALANSVTVKFADDDLILLNTDLSDVDGE